MRVHVINASNSGRYAAELEQNHRLRHRIFVDLQGWEAIRRPDGRDVDEFDNAQATHLLVMDGDEIVGGSRFNPHTSSTLLTGVFPDMMVTGLPDAPERGSDWTRFYVRPDRREGRRRAPEASALFCSIMEVALLEGLTYITFVSSIYMVELGTSLGWTITPLGAPAFVDGKPTIAAWIEVSRSALDNVRATTRSRASYLHHSYGRIAPELPELHLGAA